MLARTLFFVTLVAAIGGMAGCVAAIFHGESVYWLAGIPGFPILGFVVATIIDERWVNR